MFITLDAIIFPQFALNIIHLDADQFDHQFPLSSNQVLACSTSRPSLVHIQQSHLGPFPSTGIQLEFNWLAQVDWISFSSR